MIASGWGIIYFTQSQKIEELIISNEEKKKEITELKATSDNYKEILGVYMTTTYQVENYKKELMPDNRVAPVYDYIRTINQGTAATEINFNWKDSVTQNSYGLNSFSVSGSGPYRNLYNFIQRIERSKPLYKITSLQLQSVNSEGRLNEVNFEFSIDSYYNRNKDNYKPTREFNRISKGLTHNPFSPLIYNVPSNADNLLNVEDSRLIALSNNKAYMINQAGSLNVLSIGDPVYLGTVESVEKSSVTFLLNRGGLSDRVTIDIKTKL